MGPLSRRPLRRAPSPCLGRLALAVTLAAAWAGCAKEADRGARPSADRRAAKQADRGARPSEDRREAKEAESHRLSRRMPGNALPAATAPADKAQAGATVREKAPGPAAGKLPADRPFRGLRVIGQGRRGEASVRHFAVNPTIDTDEEPSSSFAVDTSTASYSLAGAALDKGQLPPEAAVRVEEFLGAFDLGYPAPGPADTAPIALHAALAPSPHRPGYHVLHLGLQARRLPAQVRPPATLVLVVDVSRAAGGPRRIGLLQGALRVLAPRLRAEDRLAMVSSGAEGRAALPPTSGKERARILKAVEALRVGAGPNAQAGLRLGCRLARQGRRPGGEPPQVLLWSDGLASAGVTSADGILQEIRDDGARGIRLTVLGVGLGAYRDVLLETVAREAGGAVRHVDRLEEALGALEDALSGAPRIVAKDVKVQVSFDPKVVSRYRLIGYERGGLEGRRFADDRQPGGALGAGQGVTALYEVRLRPGQRGRSVGALRVRFALPGEGRARQLQRALPAPAPAATPGPAPAATRLAQVVAAFAEKLRGSYWVRAVRYESLLAELDGLPPALLARAEVKTLRRRIEAARRLDRRGDRYSHIVPADRMSFDRVPILK